MTVTAGSADTDKHTGGFNSLGLTGCIGYQGCKIGVCLSYIQTELKFAPFQLHNSRNVNFAGIFYIPVFNNLYNIRSS